MGPILGPTYIQIRKLCYFNTLRNTHGGEGGIRTPDRLAPMPHFECGAFNHSATSPGAKNRRFIAVVGGLLGEDGGPDKAPGRDFRAPKPTKRSPKWSI